MHLSIPSKNQRQSRTIEGVHSRQSSDDFWTNLIPKKPQDETTMDDLANASTPHLLKLMERRQKTKRITEQRQGQDKRRRDELMKTQRFEVNDVVLIRHENPSGLESR
ncbi:hypothetical protein [Absidia glauca]|uniref:Uncharacterized protein n=1 Tax=Absidia glauca TaxID=4829 RepID=A0A168N921_ABSGL|nr:hypothetical protein [Absidia glauca]